MRLKMAATPAILIFEGYSYSDMEFEALERAIADDFLLELVSKLLAPPLGHLNTSAELERFRQNRIVILSDARLSGDISAENLEIPLPEQTIMKDVFDLQPLQNKAEVGEIFGGVVRATVQSEGVLFAVDTLVSVVKGGLVTEGNDGNQDLRKLRLDIQRALEDESRSSSRNPGESLMAAVVRVLLDRIYAASPQRYWLLVLIASTPGGLREDTLRRLIAAASKVTSADFKPIEVIPLCPNPSDAIADLKFLCGSLLTDRKSDDFEGLRGAHTAEFPSEFDSQPLDRERRSTCAMDLAMPEVRRALLARVLPTEIHRIQTFHRLLAEEALTQATVSFRHDPDQSSVRSLRRLLSVLYHGFMSVPIRRMELADAHIRSIDFAMPTEPLKLWEWLYLFAYRRLIERPPAWRLSRIYGADAIKREILQIVERPWKLWGRYPAALTFIQKAEGSLILPASPDGKTEKIALDFFISKSQAAYSLGKLDEAALALQAAVPVSGNTPRSKLRLAKRQLDLALLEQDAATAADVEAKMHSMLGESATAALQAYIESVAAKLAETAGAGNFEPRVHVPSAVSAIDALKSGGDCRGWGPDELSEISDILFRIGERYALEGDTKYSEATISMLTRGTRRIRPGDSAFLDCLTTSMAYFRLAEALRLQAFSDSPSGDHFFASGHSARQFVRVALKLERYSREQMAKDWAPVPGFFARKARQMSDVVTRHLYQYPRERASLLILESSMARLIPGGESRAAALSSARAFLQRAEPVVLALGIDARVRMRFLLERIKIHRRMSRFWKAEDRRFALTSAEIDLASLGELIARQRLPLWRNLLVIQKEAVAAAKREVGR